MFLEIGLLGFFVILFWLWKRDDGSNEKFPKKPRGLPILGNLHQLGNEPYKTFQKFGESYGDIFSLQLGGLRAVVLNNHKDIREAFSISSLSGRPINNDSLQYTGGVPRGVLANTGSSWMEQRRFAVKTLKDFGYGKKSMEPIIHAEVLALIESFKELASEGKPFVTTHIFNAAVVNVIWSMVNGERLEHNDPELHEAIEALTTMSTQSSQVSVRTFFPWLDRILSKLPGGSFEDALSRTVNKLGGFVEKSIAAHESRFELDAGEPRDFIEAYLSEIAKTTDHNSTFFGEAGRKNLVITCTDLFLAGSETTATTLSWIFLLLAMYPEKQEKMHEEIRRVVGTSRLPSLEEDRPSMPYTEAVIAEVMRFSAMIPMALAHTAMEDVTFKNYKIPKGTLIIPNVYMASHDEKIWLDPANFRPERFLSEDGDKFIKHEAWIPFSAGKRICIGMNLAQNELFLFTTGIFQKFRVAPHPDNVKELTIDYTFSTILFPKPQNMIFYDRMEE